MPLSTPKTVDLGGGLTLVEPSTQAYRLLSEIIRGTADAENNVNVSTYKAGIILLCLYKDGQPYIREHANMTGNQTIAEVFQVMHNAGEAVDILDGFSATETCSWMDMVYDTIDKNIIPLSKKESLREKND